MKCATCKNEALLCSECIEAGNLSLKHGILREREQSAQMKEALTILVAAKDRKEQVGKDELYKQLAEQGWKLAREALHPQNP